MTIESRNPATGEMVARYDPLTAPELDERIRRATAAFEGWRRSPVPARARILSIAADRLEVEADRLGRLMTIEMGKLAAAAREEVRKCAYGCRFYAEHGEALLRDEEVATEAARTFVRYDPLGVIFAIMPWNFPFWQVFRFAAPALLAGNAVLLKHAPNVPQCALAIEDLLRRAGLPENVFQTLLIEVDQAGAVLEDDRIAAVTLTGSDRAGRDVAGRAGRTLKKSVLELGGSDPFIVMPSADLDAAVETAVKSRTLNAGQSCIAAKRFIVSERVADRFLEAFVPRMASLRVGDPSAEATELGPMARADLVDALAAQVRDAVAHGARVLTGGEPLEGPGCYFPPTVLADVPRSARAYREELFGPVAMVFRVGDADEAIALANDTPYGLGASVWTQDDAERRRFVEEIEAGQVFVNAMVASDPRVPFGGVKRSGYGRELGVHGIREFVNVKTVWIR